MSPSVPYSMRTNTGAEADPPPSLRIEPEPVTRTWIAPSGFAAEAIAPPQAWTIGAGIPPFVCNGALPEGAWFLPPSSRSTRGSVGCGRAGAKEKTCGLTLFACIVAVLDLVAVLLLAAAPATAALLDFPLLFLLLPGLPGLPVLVPADVSAFAAPAFPVSVLLACPVPAVPSIEPPPAPALAPLELSLLPEVPPPEPPALPELAPPELSSGPELAPLELPELELAPLEPPSVSAPAPVELLLVSEVPLVELSLVSELAPCDLPPGSEPTPLDPAPVSSLAPLELPLVPEVPLAELSVVPWLAPSELPPESELAPLEPELPSAGPLLSATNSAAPTLSPEPSWSDNMSSSSAAVPDVAPTAPKQVVASAIEKAAARIGATMTIHMGSSRQSAPQAA
jgi:hypothetical protein